MTDDLEDPNPTAKRVGDDDGDTKFPEDEQLEDRYQKSRFRIYKRAYQGLKEQYDIIRERLEKRERRLEIDHLWETKAPGSEELVRVEVPFDERDQYPDGISCRDETIDLLERRVATLREERDRLREALEFYADWGNWDTPEPPSRPSQANALLDYGCRARAALSERDGE